jgi:phytoene synthase
MTVPLSVSVDGPLRSPAPGAAAAPGADARRCAAVVREHARTFYFASWLLPPEKRRAAYALYAFCRVADDLVDRAQGRFGRAPSPAEVARQLAEYERALDLTLAAAPGSAARTLTAARLPGAAAPHAAVFRELREVLDRYGVPEPVLRELLAGVGRDLAPSRVRHRGPTWCATARGWPARWARCAPTCSA